MKDEDINITLDSFETYGKRDQVKITFVGYKPFLTANPLSPFQGCSTFYYSIVTTAKHAKYLIAAKDLTINKITSFLTVTKPELITNTL